MTPRFFTVGSKYNVELSSVIESDKDLSCDTEFSVPMRIISVLVWLSLRKLSESQLEIVRWAFWRNSMFVTKSDEVQGI